jgi:hypothetical protein
MEAAKVRAGLEPSQPIPKGMPILWSKNMQKTRRRLDRRHVWTATIRANALHQWTTVVIRRDLGCRDAMHREGGDRIIIRIARM